MNAWPWWCQMQPKSHREAFIAQLWKQMNDLRESYLCCILWASRLKIQSYQKALVHLLLSLSSFVAHCGCYWHFSFANLSVEWGVLQIFG